MTTTRVRARCSGRSPGRRGASSSLFADAPIIGPGEPAHVRFIRHARSSFSRHDSIARNIANVRPRCAGWRPRRLGGRWRADAGRYLVVGGCRFVLDARASDAPVRRGSQLQHSALRRRQPARAARRDRRQPERRNRVWLRQLRAFIRNHAGLRRRVRAVRLPVEPLAAQSARRADADARRRRRGSTAASVATCAGAWSRRVPAARRLRHLAAAATHLLVTRPAQRVPGGTHQNGQRSGSSTISDRQRSASGRSVSTSTINS